MSEKEATVYIVDVGKTMGERSNGRKETNLEWALQYVWDKITTTIATGRKTAMAGVVGLRTDGTKNDLGDEDSYKNITVFEEIGQLLMSNVRRLQQELIVSNTSTGDAASALVIAIQMIEEKCKQLKYKRQVILITDGRSPMDAEDLSQITQKIKEDNMELTVLGVDFDDPDFGFKEEDKDSIKAENEEIFKNLCNDCGGIYGTLLEAVDELQTPRIKSTRPMPSFKGLLTLGNPNEYADALTIDVERYPKTMQAKPPNASKFYMRQGIPETATQSNATVDGEEAGDGMSTIKNARTYQINDEEAPGGKRDIPFDELSKGYSYGSTAVPIAASDMNVTQFETNPGLDIMGFVDKHQYQQFLHLERSYTVISQKHNEKASMALSSFIHALYELDTYAVARLVTKADSAPSLVMLAPNIEPDLECLYEVPLPFAEDVRNFKFPPLDRVVTVSGKELGVHRNLPSDDLLDAMSSYVDAMDLSTFAKDDEGNATEFAPPSETYSPLVHRINHAIKHRAIFPNADVLPIHEILTRYSQPPEALLTKANLPLQDVIRAASVKRIPPKARGKRWASRKEAPKPLSDLDVASLLARDTKRTGQRIDPKNAIPEFKQMIENAEKVEVLHEACKQMKFIVFDWVKHSVGKTNYHRAIEAIRAMREQMLEMEEPAPFNEFMRELKKKVFGGELGGDRGEFWFLLRVQKYRLITKGEVEVSDVGDEEAVSFMRPPQQ